MKFKFRSPIVRVRKPVAKRGRKLGRNRSPNDKRTLFISKYLTAELPAPPPVADWRAKVAVPWGMLGNGPDASLGADFPGAGCCVVAGAAHAGMGWNFNAGRIWVPTSEQVLNDYSILTGYDRYAPLDSNGENPTDQGTDPLAALKYWRETGICGRTIGAFAQIHGYRPVEVMQTIYLFGSCFMGFQLPAAIENAADTWDIPDGQQCIGEWALGSWGGHMVLAVGYDEFGVYVVSWGQIYRVSWKFIGTYCDEPFAVLSDDLLDSTGLCPAGFNMPALQADLMRVTR